MAQLALSNIISFSVSETNLGLNEYNTSNLALFSDEVPADSFGSAGFKSYVDAISVATDFGTASKTAQMATNVFAQQPNILAGDGQLIIILLGVATVGWTFSGVAVSGSFIPNYDSNAGAAINWNDTAAQIQTKLRAMPGLASVVVTGSIASEAISISMSGVYGASPSAFTFTSNTLMTSGSTAITVTSTVGTPGQSIVDAITTSNSLVQYFGLMVTETITDIGSDDVLAAAAVISPLNKIAFWVSYEEADIQTGGVIYELQQGGFQSNRGLYYGDDSVESGYTGLNATLMMAAYAGRALSVDFSGSNTTFTMNLKTLINVQPDPTMTQTIYNEAKTVGADIYPSIQGDPAVISNGANDYFDNQYNVKWFVGALQIGSYNYLAQTATKVPQTENGMSGLKNSWAQVCLQGVNNGFISPGSWTSPTTFGVQALLLANIAQQGFYIYTQPIAQQAQADRMNRIAPLGQIAIKYTGAIQSASGIVYVNP